MLEEPGGGGDVAGDGRDGEAASDGAESSLQAGDAAPATIFDKIISKQIPATVVFEDEVSKGTRTASFHVMALPAVALCNDLATQAESAPRGDRTSSRSRTWTAIDS